jgi:hypothetical protein
MIENKKQLIKRMRTKIDKKKLTKSNNKDEIKNKIQLETNIINKPIKIKKKKQRLNQKKLKS